MPHDPPDAPSEAMPPTPQRHSTSVVKTLWPGQRGTLKLVGRFGSKLICVRYRHDSSDLLRFTTVELVIDTAPVRGRRNDEKIYDVRIGLREYALQTEAKADGARWNPAERVWRMKGKSVKRLALYTRVQKK